MKILRPLILFFFLFGLFTGVSAQTQIEQRECYNSSDIENFETIWKISSTIEFQFGHVFCKLAKSDETDTCAANYAMESSNVKDLLSSYIRGTESCRLQIIESCTLWCMTYLKNEVSCTPKCQLRNFQTVD